MTLQAVRVSFYCFERLMTSLKSLFLTSLVGIFAMAFAMEFTSIREAVVDGVSSFRRMTSLEIPNMKVVFKSPEEAPAIALFGSLDEAAKHTLVKDMSDLKPELFERLLNIGALPKLCEFEHPNAQILQDLSLDRKLKEMGLVKLEIAPDVRASVLEDMKRAIAAHNSWDIGQPVTCYLASLEPRGWNVKTAVLQYLSAGLGGAALRPEGQTQPKPAKVARFASR